MDVQWTPDGPLNLIQSNLSQDNLNQSINQSIYQEENEMIDGLKDGLIDTEKLRRLIACNIELVILYDLAKRNGVSEVSMVTELYETICDMVCIPRDKVIIKQTEDPWEIVKQQFMKLRRVHISNILNRIIDADLKIKNMGVYLISSLYSESLNGTITEQAELHDEYLKYIRGTPYSI